MLERIAELEEELHRLKAILNRYSFEEAELKVYISDQELICINEIERLRNQSKDLPLVPEQVETLEKLTKILERERNKIKKEKKQKSTEETDVGKLLKLASGEDAE